MCLRAIVFLLGRLRRKHLSDVPSTLIRIAELHVLFCGVENRNKGVLTILVCHSSLCDCIVVAQSPHFLLFVARQFALPIGQKLQS